MNLGQFRRRSARSLEEFDRNRGPAVTMPLGQRPSSQGARTRVVILSGLSGLGAILLLLGSDGPAPPRDPSQAAGPAVRPNPGSSEGDAVHALARLEPAAG